MKKRNFKHLAFLGLTSGLIVANQSPLNAQNAKNSSSTDLAAEYQNQRHQRCGAKGCGAFVAEKENTSTKPKPEDPNSQNMGYHVYTEQELLIELNDEGQTLYNSLDAEGKALARKVASQRCQGSNDCKGLNACKTDKNECAGKGSCKGQSKCAIADKNLAVKLAAKFMASKRGKLMGN